jgi:hypothetical protein
MEAKMNNLEKLLEQYENGEKNTLLSVMLARDCAGCPASNCCVGGSRGCSEARAHWLLQEYVEPDSWEKIENDMFNKTTGEYWGCAGFCGNCSECPASVDGKNPRERFNARNCVDAKLRDIMRRCKALAGVE